MRGFAWLVLGLGLTGWMGTGFAGVSPSLGAQSQSGAKIKPAQQEEKADPADTPNEEKR